MVAAAVLVLVAVAGGTVLLIGDDGPDAVTVTGPDETAAPLQGEWQLAALLESGERQPTDSGAAIVVDGDTLRVVDDGCGNGSQATLHNGVVGDPGPVTLIGCTNDAAARVGSLFWQALGQNPTYEVHDDELWLLNDGNSGLIFDRASPSLKSPAVSVATEGLGPVIASVSPLAPSPQGWFEHTITLENTAADTVYLQDFRSGNMLGNREVAVATEGCGYGAAGDEPAAMGCQFDYRPIALEPGGSHTVTVTLWRDLAGMNPPGDGPFIWEIAIDRSDEPFTHTEQTGAPGTLIITYENLTASQPPAAETTEAPLASYLVSDQSISELFPELPRTDGSARGGYVTVPTDSFGGPSANAIRGVRRVWGASYSHRFDEPVEDIVISVSSTAIELPTSEDATRGAEQITNQAVSEGSAPLTTASPFQAFCQPPAGADTRSCVAVATIGHSLIVVDLNYAGDPQPTQSFSSLVDAAATRLG